MTPTRRAPAGAPWMLGACLSFTAMAVLTKLASVHGVPIGQIVFFRGLVSLVGVAAYMRFADVSFATRHVGAHVRRSAIGYVGVATYLAGITLLPLSSAVTINYTSPLWLALMLVAVHRERPRASLLVAAVAGLAGVVLLLRPTLTMAQWPGAVVAVTSALCGALTALNIRALGRLDEPPLRTVFYFSALITAFSLPWWLASDPLRVDATGLACLLGIGAFAMVGQWLVTHAFRVGDTMLMSVLGYSQVVFASLLGTLLWNDALDAGAWLGIALIVGSGVAVSLRGR